MNALGDTCRISIDWVLRKFRPNGFRIPYNPVTRCPDWVVQAFPAQTGTEFRRTEQELFFPVQLSGNAKTGDWVLRIFRTFEILKT